VRVPIAATNALVARLRREENISGWLRRQAASQSSAFV
jgi:hypothetical protein